MEPSNIGIDKLKAVDLSTYPIDEIKGAFREFKKFVVIGLTLHPGKSIIRARTNEADYTFKNRADLSYKPARYNMIFQRASIPEQTMFYGCVAPELNKDGDWNDPMPTALLEASRLFRGGIENGEERITFSRWVVQKDITLGAIVYHEDFLRSSSQTNELYTAYKTFLGQASDDLSKNSITVAQYLAGEFAKSEIHNEYDYLISALFTDSVLKQGFAGVYYPSVKASGKGFNVAIHPDFVDNSFIKLVAAGECMLYKQGIDMQLDNEKDASIENDSIDFSFRVITDPQIHVGRDVCYRELNKTRTERETRELNKKNDKK